MAGEKIIVVGASAGGIEACRALVGGLPPGFDAPVLVVLHVPNYSTSVLPQILSRAGLLPAKHAVDGEAIQPGTVYVAPPDHHLMVQSGQVLLSRSAAENRHRPSIDVLFRSVAQSYGQGVTGIVLSGTRDDGTAGLGVIRECGGTTIVQDPEEAQFAGMPTSAIDHGVVDHVLPIAGITALLTEADREHVPGTGTGTVPGPFGKAANHGDTDATGNGQPSGLTCPDCGGSLAEAQEGGVRRFRCRVGHAYSSEGLLAAQADGVEAALWTAVVALEERADLAVRVAEEAARGGRKISERHFLQQSQAARERANTIRDLLNRLGRAVQDPASESTAAGRSSA